MQATFLRVESESREERAAIGETLAALAEECVKSGKNITVKFRIGINDDYIITEEFAKRMAGAGASLITIHGRTKDKIYAGDVNFKEIEKAKNAVDIPVIANGGVFSLEDGKKLLKETGADGVMIARASLFNPQIFCEFSGAKEGSRYEMFEKQLVMTRELFGERFTTVFMRKMAAFYVKGMRGAAVFKDRLFKSETSDEVLNIARQIWAD